MISQILIKKLLSKVSELSDITEEEVKTDRKETSRTARKVLIEVATGYLTDTEIATTIRAEINPTFKEKQETEQRFDNIESSIKEMKNLIENFINKLA